MANFYADEQFPYITSNRLIELGHDILTVQAAGNANRGISDEDVLAFATQQNRAVLTLNRRDFIRLHRQNQDHAGIIVCTDDSDKIRLADRIHQTISKNTESSEGQLIRVVKPSN